MQRGLASGPDQPAWQEPIAPAGRRVPSAPRERKPVLAALAVLLVVGGALGAAYLVTQNAKRVSAIEIVAQVGQGQQIPMAAMQQVQIAAGSAVNYVPWSEASQVARFYAANAIPPGTLLNGAMVIRASGVTAGKDVLGLALKDGQLPRDLQIGDHIDLYDVGATAGASGSCPGKPGIALASNAVVIAVTAPSASSGSSALDDLVVALNPADAGAVVCNASSGSVGVAILPGGGKSGPKAG
jgi:hypothetical protein